MIFICIFINTDLFSQGQFKIRNDGFMQIGYTAYKTLTFGQSTGTPNNGNFAIEYADGGLNFWKPWPTASSANYIMFMRDNGNIGIGNTGNTVEKLWVSGAIKANGLNLTSDERFKENIRPIKTGLNELLQLKPYQYTFNQSLNKVPVSDSLNINVLKEDTRNYNFDSNLHFGFSAQEIQKIYPHLVSEDEKGYLSVNYMEFIPILVKGMQEQNQKISELEEKILQLQRK